MILELLKEQMRKMFNRLCIEEKFPNRWRIRTIKPISKGRRNYHFCEDLQWTGTERHGIKDGDRG